MAAVCLIRTHCAPSRLIKRNLYVSAGGWDSCSFHFLAGDGAVKRKKDGAVKRKKAL